LDQVGTTWYEMVYDRPNWSFTDNNCHAMMYLSKQVEKAQAVLREKRAAFFIPRKQRDAKCGRAFFMPFTPSLCLTHEKEMVPMISA
jgi:hypothetical protein